MHKSFIRLSNPLPLGSFMHIISNKNLKPTGPRIFECQRMVKGRRKFILLQLKNFYLNLLLFPGSINFLVMFFGAILLGNLMNKYGRKKAIQFFYVMYFVSGGMILFYNECRFYLFYISRIFSGLGNSEYCKYT